MTLDASMRRDTSMIDTIIVHCSASDSPADDNINTIRAWHLKRGFKDIGYHYFIDKKGDLYPGRPLYYIGAHCQGQNINSIGVCISGLYLFTDEQFKTAYALISDLMDKFKIRRRMVWPHNHFNGHKTCPNFTLDKIWQFEKIKDT